MNTITFPTIHSCDPTQVLEFAHVYQDQDLNEPSFIEDLKKQSDLIWQLLEQKQATPIILVDNCPYHSVAHPDFSIEALLHTLQLCNLPKPQTIYFEDNYTQVATQIITQISPTNLHTTSGIIKLKNKKGPIIQGSNGHPSCALLETTWLNQELTNAHHTVVLSQSFQKQQKQKQHIISILQQLGIVSPIQSQAIYY